MEVCVELASVHVGNISRPTIAKYCVDPLAVFASTMVD